MRLEQLYHIVKVAEVKSISLAAEQTYVSQPGISSSISKLELELGVELFKRTKQGMVPTAVGETVIHKAIEIIDSIEEIKNVTRSNAIELTGEVIIAVEPAFSNTIMVNSLTSFKYKHPKVNVMLKVGESTDILHDVLSGKADIGIAINTNDLIRSENIVTKRLVKDKLIVITGSATQMASEKSIAMKAALAQPVALYNTGYQTSCAISQVISRFGDLKVDYRFDNLKIIEDVVASGNCIAFVPKLMMNHYNDSNAIVGLPISDVDLEIDIVMMWNKRHRISTIEKELIKTIKSLCSICELT